MSFYSDKNSIRVLNKYWIVFIPIIGLFFFKELTATLLFIFLDFCVELIRFRYKFNPYVNFLFIGTIIMGYTGNFIYIYFILPFYILNRIYFGKFKNKYLYHLLIFLLAGYLANHLTYIPLTVLVFLLYVLKYAIEFPLEILFDGTIDYRDIFQKIMHIIITTSVFSLFIQNFALFLLG